MSSSLIDRILDRAATLTDSKSFNVEGSVGNVSAVSGEPWTLAVKEGELAVDVYQMEGAVVIQAAIAGVKMEDIIIEVQNDMVTIKGNRHPPTIIPEENYLYKECFWGPFSRTIVLPFEVDADAAQAMFQQGVLTVTMPQFTRGRAVTAVPIKEVSYE